jgi:hypothetical protein
MRHGTPNALHPFPFPSNPLVLFLFDPPGVNEDAHALNDAGSSGKAASAAGKRAVGSVMKQLSHATDLLKDLKVRERGGGNEGEREGGREEEGGGREGGGEGEGGGGRGREGEGKEGGREGEREGGRCIHSHACSP